MNEGGDKGSEVHTQQPSPFLGMTCPPSRRDGDQQRGPGLEAPGERGHDHAVPGDGEALEGLAIDLVTRGGLLRGDAMTGHYWQEVAGRLVARHAGQIAAAIFREQADRESGTWFVEHSQAVGVLNRCVDADPMAAWDALRPHLTSEAAFNFSVGFPAGLIDRLPAETVRAWILEQPDPRASLAARLASKDFTRDDSLAVFLLGKFGDDEDIGASFFAAYVSGLWHGPPSAHWNGLARNVEEIARRTSLPKLRRWAQRTAKSLREMAERDQQREEEWELRRR